MVVFLSVLVIAMILASLSFIALEADHECHGEDCHVCAMIIQCDNAFRNFGSVILQIFLSGLAIVLSLRSLVFCFSGFAGLLSPISSKVRLND